MTACVRREASESSPTPGRRPSPTPGFARPRRLALSAALAGAVGVLAPAPPAALAQPDAAAAARDAQDGSRNDVRGDARGDRDELGRRATNGRTTTLAFRNVTLDDLIPFIVESTGKVVLPQDTLLSSRITIINDEPIPQREAVDYVFLALMQNGVAIVETPERIVMHDITEIERLDVPVIPPDESVLDRRDIGVMAEKVYPLEFVTAEKISEDVISDSLPEYASIAFDEDSNQIVVRGPITLLQRVERLVNAIDRPGAGALRTETFKLRFADAEQIAENIRELYEDEGGGGDQQNFQRFFRRGQNNNEEDSSAPSENLRVTSNTQQNAVTVVAEPSVLEQIRTQIREVWDQPLPEEAVVPRIYDLEHTDPVRVQLLLEGLFGESDPTGGGGQAAQGQGGGNQPASGQGAGRLAGQFTFQAIPEAGRLVVIAKSPDNISIIDQIIDKIDRPQTVGLPDIVELKHADAEELAEQFNALLATEGTIAQIPRQERGLTAGGGAGASPFAEQTDTANEEETDLSLITFWWQRAQPAADQRDASNLVGRLRIVPVWRQNAVMVLSPPEYRAAVLDMIASLDRPGRQVLISAVVAEISLEDSTALGLRFSSGNIPLTNNENSITIGTNTTAQENNFLGDLFDTSVLDVNTDLNVVLQALNQNNAVNILSEPKIFTADNQEAEFFDGQDIPFVTDSQTTDTGGLIQSTEYRAVGIQLRVRPRITANQDVDLRVNLELSSITPGVTVNGQVVVDRRETTTQLIIQNGQTVVISGILRSEESDVKRKVPLLGDIPLIGALFTSIETSVENTELVAFITPIVVDNDVDPEGMDRINEPYRNRLDELREQLEGASIDAGVRPVPLEDSNIPDTTQNGGPDPDADAESR
jgi:general secretion pathway protein D